ncbi:MAG: hypothetical protein M1825_003031 [Sarcosagium campestre]|nr:MAG: hypothetical protein M1825_003031 [Sarcosagium campestre]
MEPSDADFAAALSVVEHPPRPTAAPAPPTTKSSQGNKVQQPTPQALPSRRGPSAILVAPRQKGNPILNHIHSVPWEYSDTPADYVLGATACALFLSLKYHRLHPEYIYGRIRDLAGKYNLRVLLTMVDISNHEDALRELSKTSLVNRLSLVLCWSAAEAGRYLSLFKSYENASPASIRAHQATSTNERLVDFITVPRSINKTDAISLVSNFGSLRAAMNAQPEEIAMLSGWGEKKVERWCASVREPFRHAHAKSRGGRGPAVVPPVPGGDDAAEDVNASEEEADQLTFDPIADDDDVDDAAPAPATLTTVNTSSHDDAGTTGMVGDIDPSLPAGVQAALAKLREKT